MKTKYSLRLFLTSELLLYFLILVTVFFPSACSPLCGSVLRYISVLLCPSLGFFFYLSDRNPFSQKLLLALTVSCAADYILIFTRAYTAGVLLFCTVQLFYRQALFSSDTGVLKPTLPPFVPLFFASGRLCFSGSPSSASCRPVPSPESCQPKDCIPKTFKKTVFCLRKPPS